MKHIIKDRSCATIKVRSLEDLHSLYAALRPYVMNPYTQENPFLLKLLKQLKSRLKSFNITVD